MNETFCEIFISYESFHMQTSHQNLVTTLDQLF